MMKWVLSLGIMMVGLGAGADVPTQATSVQCTRVGMDAQSNPDEAQINAWLKSRENGFDSTKSVSITYVGNNQYLVCRSFPNGAK